MKYLIDSNVWIYAAQGISPVVKFLSYALEEDWAGYSSISRVEVMGFPELTIEDE